MDNNSEGAHPQELSPPPQKPELPSPDVMKMIAEAIQEGPPQGSESGGSAKSEPPSNPEEEKALMEAMQQIARAQSEEASRHGASEVPKKVVTLDNKKPFLVKMLEKLKGMLQGIGKFFLPGLFNRGKMTTSA